jgi:hypothetical protein
MDRSIAGVPLAGHPVERLSRLRRTGTYRETEQHRDDKCADNLHRKPPSINACGNSREDYSLAEQSLQFGLVGRNVRPEDEMIPGRPLADRLAKPAIAKEPRRKQRHKPDEQSANHEDNSLL